MFRDWVLAIIYSSHYVLQMWIISSLAVGSDIDSAFGRSQRETDGLPENYDYTLITRYFCGFSPSSLHFTNHIPLLLRLLRATQSSSLSLMLFSASQTKDNSVVRM